MTLKKDEDILKTMRSRFSQSAEHESVNRQSWVKSVDMSCSMDQWPQEVVNSRGGNRPRLTINRLNGTCKQIEGDYRQNQLAINVLPASYEASDDTAEILAGMIRHIEQVSCAGSVYLHGIRYASRGGFGWARVLPEYVAEGSFEQELRIGAVYNSLTVYCDPKAVMPTREDARFMFVSEKVSRDDHLDEYDSSKVDFSQSLEDFDEGFEDWAEEDGEVLRRVEYFTKEYVPARFVRFSNGATLEIVSDAELEALKAIGWQAQQEKKGRRTQIRWRKCIANEILEERLYKMPFIPLIPFLGEEINIRGKITLRSAIAYGIDPQHMLNYMKSTATESAALMPKAPYLMTPAQIQNHEIQWKNVNNSPQPYLIYNADPKAPGPPPRIGMPEQPIGEMALANGAERDISYTTNTFDAQLGAPGQEVSGVALSERQHQGTTGNFLFIDNGKLAIEHIGRVLLGFIPLIYDTERVVRILNMEGKSSTETINREIHNPVLGAMEVLNDITVGDYQVVVEAGKAFATRRKEATEGMLKWSQAFPQQSPLVSDLVIENMDVPGGTQIAERIRRSLPPNIINDPDSPEGQQAQQAAQEQQAKQQALQEQMMQSKLQVEQGKNQAALAKANAEVVKAGAEVTKAKADTIQAIAQTHNTAAEHAADVLDQDRMSPGIVRDAPGAPASFSSQQQSSVQPQSAPQIQLVKSPQDQQREELLHQAVAGIATHLLESAHHNRSHTEQLHGLLAQVANGNERMAAALTHHAAVAAAPVEAIRDKSGRITGSRKVLNASA